MFGRYSERAQRVIILAQDEARRLDYNYVGTEHLLLGLIREGHGVAARALRDVGVDLDHVRAEIERTLGRGSAPPSGEIAFTPRAKKVIMELAIAEARALGHSYVGTEHLLLGLIREHEAPSARLLENLGADLERVRRVAAKLLGVPGPPPPASAPARATEQPPVPARAAEQAPVPAVARLCTQVVVLDGERRLLLYRRSEDPEVWALPGGDVRPGELTREAAIRMAREQAGLEIACDRLVWVVEAARPYVHRVTLYHLAHAAPTGEAPGRPDVRHFARDEVPPGVRLPSGFWRAADAGFMGHDPGAGGRME